MADVADLEAKNVFGRLGADPDLWWVILGVRSTGGKPALYVQAEGGTSVKAMSTFLRDDELQYGCIKILGVDSKGAVTSTRTKFAFFQWVGPRVPKIRTAQAIPVKRAAQNYFSGHHISLEAYERSVFDETDLEARLRACGGAHQPSDFKFGSGENVTLHEGFAGAEPAAAEAPAASGGASPAAASDVGDASAAASPAPAAAAAASPPGMSRSLAAHMTATGWGTGGGAAPAPAAHSKGAARFGAAATAVVAAQTLAHGAHGAHGSSGAPAAAPAQRAALVRAAAEAQAALVAVGKLSARLTDVLSAASAPAEAAAPAEDSESADSGAAAAPKEPTPATDAAALSALQGVASAELGAATSRLAALVALLAELQTA